MTVKMRAGRSILQITINREEPDMNAEQLQQQIREWKEKRNAVILAHNYADEEREHVWMQ